MVTCYRLADEAQAGRRTVKRLRVDSMPQLEGSVAAACALWLGRRASELVDRQVRDLIVAERCSTYRTRRRLAG